ncbi:hypothetical protein L208DRAFT_1064332, partial [Tricholoma matsutake]
EIGEVCKDRTHMGHAPLMSQEAVMFMLVLLDHDPDLYLDEIQQQLEDQHGVIVSLATVWQTLRRLGITSKKLSRAALERCADACQEFTLKVGNEPPERLVCVDEAAVNILTSYRENGWSRQGLHARKRTKFVCGTQ